MEYPVNVVEHFHGVYLLYCRNPKRKGDIYIGYTVNPNRRIKQHNAGRKFGGAWRTSNRGPWTMVMIIHGFPNQISALKFEWAWQHPEKSRRLKQMPRKKYRQNGYDYRLLILSEMLRVGPWTRLPLTIRWLAPDFAKDFPPDRSPPFHMPLVYGKVISKKLECGNNSKKVNKKQEYDDRSLPSGSTDQTTTTNSNSIQFCYICNKLLEQKERLACISPTCSLVSHFICLAKKFQNNDNMILPIEGTCPKCNINLLWGDLIRKMKGCYQDLAEAQDTDSDSGLSDFGD